MKNCLPRLRENFLCRALLGLYQFFTCILYPIVELAMRVWIARIFWLSGLTKIDSWEITVLLFQEEYKVPFLSPETSAFFATFFEIACPALLVIGLMTRLATLPLLVMTYVIHVYNYSSHMEHWVWALLLGLILTKGPSALSIDYWIDRCSKPKKT